MRLTNASPLAIAPSQSRPVNLWFSTRYVGGAKGINIAFIYTIAGQQSEQVTSITSHSFCHSLIQSPHKFTFLHPSGAVSYAILRPPTSRSAHSAFPVLLNLHGAGLESDSNQVRHMLDAAPDLDAWVLFPTGMSPWSGDDWHVWGFGDVSSAVSAIPEWIRNMNWNGPGVDIEGWVVTGHSNGGQGAWFISTHQPDKVVATAAVSGYSSIQNYVPYVMWREASPLADSVIQNALISYRHELLLGNVTGVPIYQQHGSKDDNVPPYHSRLLNTLLHEAGCLPQYVELSEKTHWFDGAMTTNPLKTFYSSVLHSKTLRKEIPPAFEFVIPNSGDVGSRAGIVVDQLQTPDHLGRLKVCRNDRDHLWQITTSNIHRMHFCLQAVRLQGPKAIIVDDTLLRVSLESSDADEVAIVRNHDKWDICDGQNWKVLSARYGRQRGSLDAILRTCAPFKIQVCSPGALEPALQVSRNLLQYYGADAEIIIPEKQLAASNAGNTITVVVGRAIPLALLDKFPIQVGENDIQIRRPHTGLLIQIPFRSGLGIAFIRPLPAENLELVLWGHDDVGLQQAVRMVPILTGSGQPDFVVLGHEARWLGHAGVLAMGFFDHAWKISQASYLP